MTRKERLVLSDGRILEIDLDLDTDAGRFVLSDEHTSVCVVLSGPDILGLHDALHRLLDDL